jgi:hypothetical protein
MLHDFLLELQPFIQYVVHESLHVIIDVNLVLWVVFPNDTLKDVFKMVNKCIEQ